MSDVTEREALVSCKHKPPHQKWVAWDDRHAGSEYSHPNHYQIRCSSCPSGQDFTFYQGKFREKGDK